VVRDLDQGLATTACGIYGIAATAENIGWLQLTYREGGYNYAPAAPYADIAFLASVIETKKLQTILAPSLRHRNLLDDNDVTRAYQRLSETNPYLVPIIGPLLRSLGTPDPTSTTSNSAAPTAVAPASPGPAATPAPSSLVRPRRPTVTFAERTVSLHDTASVVTAPSVPTTVVHDTGEPREGDSPSQRTPDDVLDAQNGYWSQVGPGSPDQQGASSPSAPAPPSETAGTLAAPPAPAAEVVTAAVSTRESGVGSESVGSDEDAVAPGAVPAGTPVGGNAAAPTPAPPSETLPDGTPPAAPPVPATNGTGDSGRRPPPAAEEPQPHQLQRKWSEECKRATLEARMVAAGATTEAQRADLKSNAGSHANVHPLVDDSGYHAKPWLNGPQTLMIARLRCHLRLYSQPGRCTLCPAACWVDVYGRHAKNCLGSGLKNRIHNAAVKTLERLLRLAMCAPLTEQRPFHNSSLRIDIIARELIMHNQVCVMDYACINGTNDPPRTRASAANSGGAATAYEQTKHATYGAAARASNLNVIPMIQDIHGAWGDHAKKTLRHLFRLMARRFGRPVSHVARVWKTEIQSLHEQRIANYLLSNQNQSTTPAMQVAEESGEV
jgi:hypothetical protein